MLKLLLDLFIAIKVEVNLKLGAALHWLLNLLVKEVTNGLLCCIVRMIDDHQTQAMIVPQLDAYTSISDSTLNQLAVDERSKMPPGLGAARHVSICFDRGLTVPLRAALWWASYGDRSPELQMFAIKILSQPCSSASRFKLKKDISELVHEKEAHTAFIARSALNQDGSFVAPENHRVNGMDLVHATHILFHISLESLLPALFQALGLDQHPDLVFAQVFEKMWSSILPVCQWIHRRLFFHEGSLSTSWELLSQHFYNYLHCLPMSRLDLLD
ncbi:hypothetical protein HPP92_015288 [Vanilla planifolia]|uniref:HAT C-terminal dimerisation domain-containing protein n=1 Tax=Vanilla planifolia TaxID=51239 RepID=A0A835QXH3_VANPL|nr:hypothetical protein HPP92_015288 [Vanilla planifolia]